MLVFSKPVWSFSRDSVPYSFVISALIFIRRVRCIYFTVFIWLLQYMKRLCACHTIFMAPFSHIFLNFIFQTWAHVPWNFISESPKLRVHSSRENIHLFLKTWTYYQHGSIFIQILAWVFPSLKTGHPTFTKTSLWPRTLRDDLCFSTKSPIMRKACFLAFTLCL